MLKDSTETHRALSRSAEATRVRGKRCVREGTLARPCLIYIGWQTGAVLTFEWRHDVPKNGCKPRHKEDKQDDDKACGCRGAGKHRSKEEDEVAHRSDGPEEGRVSDWALLRQGAARPVQPFKAEYGGPGKPGLGKDLEEQEHRREQREQREAHDAPARALMQDHTQGADDQEQPEMVTQEERDAKMTDLPQLRQRERTGESWLANDTSPAALPVVRRTIAVW